MVNQNGAYVYTNIAVINVSDKLFTVFIYPNPAATIFNIAITNPTRGRASIALYDALGKRVALFAAANATNQVLPLPVDQLQPGTYWVEVTTSENR